MWIKTEDSSLINIDHILAIAVYPNIDGTFRIVFSVAPPGKDFVFQNNKSELQCTQIIASLVKWLRPKTVLELRDTHFTQVII